jgi:WG repeat protein
VGGAIGLWIALTASGVDTLACTPIPPAGEASIPACADQRTDGTVQVHREGLRALAFDADGLAIVFIRGEFYYVNRAGRTAAALRFDNGADYFAEGLARTVRNGKIGFIDKRLVEIVPARWDFALPYERGVAVVCNGCRPVRESGHERIEGGTWGYIDRKGRPVVAPVHAHEALPSVDEAVKASKHVP